MRLSKFPSFMLNDYSCILNIVTICYSDLDPILQNFCFTRFALTATEEGEVLSVSVVLLS